jgi:hypothetical protein
VLEVKSLAFFLLFVLSFLFFSHGERTILQELNVKELVLTTKNSYVSFLAKPDNQKLGKRLRKDFEAVAAAIKGNVLGPLRNLHYPPTYLVCPQQTNFVQHRAQP